MSDPQLSLAPGATLHDTYVLEAPLGRGGMGAVWRARHARLPRPVAIKVLHEHAYESEEILLRFRREAEITSQLGHPHIVEVFDFNVLDDGRAYLVMELLEGQSLRERVREGPPLTLAEVLTLLDQVASALAHAHRAGVVHRDLKPENVFLVANHEGRIHAKVLDFGISKMQGAHTVLTQGASLMGTPRYMSPEQARGGTAEVDGRADQFSLGAIAYELLAGRAAFAGTSVTQVLLRVLEEQPEPLGELAPSVPPEVVGAVERALEKDREARFSDMDALRRVLGGGGPPEGGAVPVPPRPVSVAPTDPDAFDDTVRRPATALTDAEPPPPGAPSGPGRRVRAVAVALLVGLALGGGVWWGLRDRGPASAAPLVGADAGAQPETGPAGGAAPEADAAPPAEPESTPQDGGPVVAPKDAGSAAAPVDAGVPRRRPVRPAPLPPRLQAAEAALRARDFDRAIRDANRSLREDDDPRAHAVAAIAYCGKRDLAAANARLRQTPRGSRRRVRVACRREGMELAP